MSKRQTRIFTHQLAENAKNLIGKEVNVVLLSGKTWSATVKKIDKHQILIQDHFLQKHNVRLEEIREIVLDFVATY
jgi:small nuclear ribonucleoprotein (snRNP)-like protein